MASRNQQAIDPVVKLVAIAIAMLVAIGLVFSVASGFGSHVTGFLLSLNVGKDTATSVGGVARNGLLAILLAIGLWAYFR